MSCEPIESLLYGTRRSRCPAGSGTVAGKRCAPGSGDAGVCAAPAAGLRVMRNADARPPRALRRKGKAVRSVCRVWWDARTEQDLERA